MRTSHALTWASLLATAGCCLPFCFPTVPDINTNGLYTVLEHAQAECDGGSMGGDTQTELLQFSGSGSSLNYTSEDGCTFDFNVSNDVATLSNGPVSCDVTNDGGTAELNVTSYTITFSDAGGDPALTLTQQSTYREGAVFCTITVTGTGEQ